MPVKEMVSCICPTYGRAPYYLHLLEECVFWFLAQDYDGPKELVILNDCAEQTLICDAPGVRVINEGNRFSSLGVKYNALLLLAKGDIILPWEDDDISLPHRIRQCVEGLAGFEYYNPQQSWYEDTRGLHYDHTHGYCHNASAYRKNVMLYAPYSGSQDAEADGYAKANLSCSPRRLHKPHQWDYIYRFGVSNYHLSGFHDTELAYSKHKAAMGGTYFIAPKMRKDYVKLTGDILCGACSLSSGCRCRGLMRQS